MKKDTKRSSKRTFFPEKIKYLGIHLIAEFWLVKTIEDKKIFEKILRGAVRAAKCTLLEITIHKFSPQGMTGVILLAESHIAIHTWPENNYLAVDIFTCGDKAKPYLALEFLKKRLKPEKFEIREIKRGKIKQ